LALITNKPRTASVTTTLASELFEIDRRAVEEVALSHSSITEEIVGFARRRLLTNLLATSRVFTPFNEAQRLEVLRAFVSKVVAKGSVIIEEGSEPKGLYLVLEGEVEVTKTDAAGDRMVLAYLREGDVFGEIGLVNDQPTTATVTAAEKSVLLVLDRARFQALTSNHPKILEYLSTISDERLAENKDAMSSEGVILDADDLIIL
jgi:CRP-like cAMP-binding protein